MKNIMLTLVLITATGAGVAFGKQGLPRLAAVHLDKIVPLHTKLSITKPLGLLPAEFLQQDNRDKLPQEQRLGCLLTSNTLAFPFCSWLTYQLLTEPLVYHTYLTYPIKFTALVLSAANIMFTKEAVEKKIEFIRTKDTFARLNVEDGHANDIVIYESQGQYRIGTIDYGNQESLATLDAQVEEAKDTSMPVAATKEKQQEVSLHTDNGQHYTAEAQEQEVTIAVTDAQGNTEDIGYEQIVQLVVIRDGLPSNINIFGNKQKLTAISANLADDYRDATLAFTYQGENYLAIVKDVTLAADGQGELNIVTATGEELRIRRGKRGQPELLPLNEHDTKLDIGVKIRGVLFMP